MPTIDERLATLTAATEENTRNIRQLAMIAEDNERRVQKLVESQTEIAKEQAQMRKMLQWLIRNVRMHEQRMDRFEDRRPT